MNCHQASTQCNKTTVVTVKAMISGGTVGEERPQVLAGAHLWRTRSFHITVVLLQRWTGFVVSLVELKMRCPLSLGARWQNIQLCVFFIWKP